MEEFIKLLKDRFEENINRHPNLNWNELEKKLIDNPKKVDVLKKMEETGGEPDVVFYDSKNNEFHFFDCSTESPIGRRSLCYDNEALESRKEHKPKNSAINLAKSIGVELLTEEQYVFLQSLGNFDTKTSSWLSTENTVRKLGGAIFGDKRYNRVFIYHNGAESYYAARGFRSCFKV
ncbi:DUF4256 domain-containing protein [Flavobacterium sp.]|uniref:DUF4256 domain-containing protein n=1 Tax=Flavobacterium sp. TaxID=239 RepID=UPI0035B29FD0